MSLLFHLVSLFLVSVYCAENVDIVCRDESGNPVDWYYLYKLPKEYSNNLEEDNQPNGLQYLYISSATANEGWKLSEHTIDDEQSFPGETIACLLANPDIAFIAYNDQPPYGPLNNTNGHTKGVVAADSSTGFWLIHSVPNYPNLITYRYPQSGTAYGQSFLCLSFNAAQIDLVGKQQIFNEPNIYHSQLPDDLRDVYPHLVEAVNGKWQTEEPFYNHQILETRGGAKFSSFAKSRMFKRELYEDWVAPTLGVDLFVESWRHGTGILSSNCSRRHHVLNVQSIAHPDLNINFRSTNDHSKWCVAEGVEDTWICVGDINRAEHQLVRGGGTVCQLNDKIYEAYRDLISDIEPCPVEE